MSSIPILDLSPEVEAHWAEFQAAFERVVRSGQFIMGPDVMAFEAEAAEFLGVRHAVGVNSGTDALVIALRALGVGPGDEVITTAFSFFATAESISLVGAKPVFVDIDPDTYNLDVQQVRAAITPQTKALMPVHLYGQSADMGALMTCAQEHGLLVVEDCAQSFGAQYHAANFGRAADAWDGQQTGTMGHAGAYSFFPSKNLGAFGDAGLLVTNDDAVAEQARMLRAHGSRRKYHNETLGFNSRLDTLQAAILRVKLGYLPEQNRLRREVAARYTGLLAGLPSVKAPAVTPGHVFHQYTIELIGFDRDAVQRELAARGIGTMVYYPVPQDALPVYSGQYTVQPRSAQASQQVLSLPIWPTLSAELQHQVVSALTDVLGTLAPEQAPA
ncbi:DegT/DnrJ/EryC1/StrS family aminotransferase [Deinococcus multiflagellatus]|uniref:DegT/DnrJ/EryC1/StrS family aminotransferase n=1 Tax=Deinococcus multiflagellatus TaxID=1656887 RepID=A0ABW1ZPD0_9DEIO|nr:DegT/DnrJ/EryC1/StrS family aminotransferase [Deinococcus multiflagellatus]MBZ9714130.1 DegT/DnrJ/EryC1/StrS family aminotransferase [Deinococcus multiflagellatus]